MTTSKRVAEIAKKQLKSPKSSPVQKSLAKSAISQSKKKDKKK